MKKKLVSFGMAAMMAASLAACGGSKPAETTAAADNAETTAAEGAETEAAAEGGTLKVGIIGPLTGAGSRPRLRMMRMIQRNPSTHTTP